jgi:hypothetical protein
MINDSVADYAMEGTDPLEVQNRLLSGIVGKRLYKMQTINSDSLLGRKSGFYSAVEKRRAWISLYSGDGAGECDH